MKLFSKVITSLVVVGSACLAVSVFGSVSVDAGGFDRFCIPSIISADDFTKLRTPPLDPTGRLVIAPITDDVAQGLINTGKLVILNQAVINLPEVQKIISDQLTKCAKEQSTKS